ncbi:MAG: cytochrome c oxidase subunit II [Anaerolineales bacterium]|nr:cytochrome c oxidase subunit II [Anaerolineales bacterium]
MKHLITVAILVVLGTLGVHAGLGTLGLLPEQASLQAIAVDKLLDVHLWLISFLFSLIVMTLAYSLAVFRRRKGETGEGAHMEGNTTLEIFWTMIPLLAVVFLAFIGAASLGEIRRIDPSALQVNVLAGQWYWQYQYPEYGIVSTELYLPVDRQVNLQMTSNDVIHSFWVPEFRVKQDLVPGQTTELRVTPNMVGEFRVLCAELCGTSHAYMESAVFVVTEEDFAAWVESQQSTAEVDPLLLGQQLVQRYGCTACHSIDGSQRTGPTWAGVFESVIPLADGTTIIADREYLIQSIINPNLHIVEGYNPNVMPSFASVLDQTQVEAIASYLETLK